MNTTTGGTPLDAVEQAFTLLATGPAPLAVDGEQLGHGLPPRLVPVDELRDLLLSRRLPTGSATAVWREVITRARSGTAAWTVAAAGLLLPGLRQAAARVAACASVDAEDVQAELLTGLLAALKTVNVEWGGLAQKLMSRAYRSALAACCGEAFPLAGPQHEATSAAPPPPCGHPDLVLAKAVAAGVITAGEADLVGRTRLEEVALADVAGELGEDYEAVLSRRKRAEARLAAAITGGDLDEITLSRPRRNRPAGGSRFRESGAAGCPAGGRLPRAA